MEPQDTRKKDSAVSAAAVEVPSDLQKAYYFGCGPCHPKWLQFLFAKKVFFTFLLSVFSFLQGGIISGLLSTVLSTLQKRYNFTSLSAGIISLVYDLAVTISVIFISYFGSKTHRPRLLGCGVLLMSFGTILFAMPHFFFGRYEIGIAGSIIEEECQDDRVSIQDCSSSNTAAYAIFILSSIIIGIAAAPIYTLGTAFIDEIVFPKYVALHIGAYGVTVIVGPLIGYGIGSAFLSTYVDPWLTTTLTPSDPAWVGAWWIPFLLFGTLLILVSTPFFMYPRYLHDSHLVQQERAKEMARIYSNKYSSNENSITTAVKLFPVEIKRLILNPSYVFMTLGFSVVSLFLQGVLTFAPKFYEVQFNLTAATAGIIVGIVAIPGGCTLTGALLVFGCKLKGRSNALIVTIVTFILTFFLLLFLLHCPQADVVGITRPYIDGTRTVYPLYVNSSTCSGMCNCTSNVLEPVCGADGMSYFSPCRAGCDKATASDGSLSFENCTCIGESLMYNDIANATATDGYCPTPCLERIIPALLGLVVIAYLAFVTQMPFIYFMLRVVADDQRALALGVQSATFRIIGSIPGPVVFGALFDAACISWQLQCGKPGNCWLYDKDQLSYSVIGIGIPCNLIAVTFYILSWLTYPKKNKKEDKKEKEIEMS